LAIGKKGQNVRLAAKLTGWKIDIKSEEEKRREVEAQLGALEIGEPGAAESTTDAADADATTSASSQPEGDDDVATAAGDDSAPAVAEATANESAKTGAEE